MLFILERLVSSQWLNYVFHLPMQNTFVNKNHSVKKCDLYHNFFNKIPFFFIKKIATVRSAISKTPLHTNSMFWLYSSQVKTITLNHNLKGPCALLEQGTWRPSHRASKTSPSDHPKAMWTSTYSHPNIGGLSGHWWFVFFTVNHPPPGPSLTGGKISSLKSWPDHFQLPPTNWNQRHPAEIIQISPL